MIIYKNHLDIYIFNGDPAAREDDGQISVAMFAYVTQGACIWA